MWYLQVFWDVLEGPHFLLLQGQAVQDHDNKGKCNKILKNTGITHLMTKHYITGDVNPQKCRCDNSKSHTNTSLQYSHSWHMDSCKQQLFTLSRLSFWTGTNWPLLDKFLWNFISGRASIAICRENWSVVKNWQKSTDGGIFNSQLWQLICCLLLL